MKKFRVFAGFVALLMVLSACYPGVASNEELSYEVQANITKGRVNLSHSVWNAGVAEGGFLDPHGSQGPWNYARVTNEGNGVASVDFSFSRSNGNWNVSGRWIDGRVQMEFGGRSEYLNALMNYCLSTVTMDDVDNELYGWDIDSNPWGYDYYADENCFDIESWVLGEVSSTSLQNGNVTKSNSRFMNLTWSPWASGGCVIVPTLYRSLNRDFPGTGHALIMACQNGPGAFALTLPWDKPSYIEVWVPDTTVINDHAIGDIDYSFDGDEDANTCYDENADEYACADADDEYYFSVDHRDDVYYADNYFENDNSPFRNYYAGGINTNRSAKWTVRARSNNLDSPAPTQSPLFSEIWLP